MKKSLYFFCFIIFFLSTNLNASTFFSGNAGGKLFFQANPEKTSFEPDLTLQAYFAGQFNFSKNIWGHLEFSINTGNLISSNIFHETDSKFQIDEISLTFNSNHLTKQNYFSVFAGTFDPIGSDVFLQRYFGIDSIASNLTQNWLGLGNSVIYPLFGMGLADVMVFKNKPVALGAYLYFDHENFTNFIFNADLRFACAFRYLTWDISCGLGIPVQQQNIVDYPDLIIAIDKLYWHAGTTFLVGNKNTQSLFIQAGVFNASFKGGTTGPIFDTDDFYILFEPRFKFKDTNVNFSVFNLPPDTVDEMMFVQTTLGFNLDINVAITKTIKPLKIGINLSGGFVGQTIFNLSNIDSTFLSSMNFGISPYFTKSILSGDFHFMLSVNYMPLAQKDWYKMFGVDIGYKTSF
ncbi:MAG: hypothetical protein GX677_08920 [Treponema sp.]|nr:hypothetical protein [Treponema sp.]